MVRKSRKTPLKSASLDSEPSPFLLSQEQWAAIGGGYCELAPEDCDRIAECVTTYMLFQPGERTVGYVENVLPHLDRIGSTASGLLKALDLFDRKGVLDQSRHEAVSRFSDCLSADIAARYGIQFSMVDIVTLAALMQVAAKRTRKTMQDDKSPGLVAHGAWRGLAWQLMDWAESKQLPVTTAKPSGAKASDDSLSPFVKFFKRLQAALPPDYREYSGSNDALIHGLNEVRRRWAKPSGN
jgi:hypothetical protein